MLKIKAWKLKLRCEIYYIDNMLRIYTTTERNLKVLTCVIKDLMYFVKKLHAIEKKKLHTVP